MESDGYHKPVVIIGTRFRVNATVGQINVMLQTCYRLVSDTMGKLPTCYVWTCYGETGVMDFGLNITNIQYLQQQALQYSVF